MADTTVELLLKVTQAGAEESSKQVQAALGQINNSINQLNQASAGQAGAQNQFDALGEKAAKLRQAFAEIGVDAGAAFSNVTSIDDFQDRLENLRNTAISVQETAATQGNLPRLFNAAEAAREAEKFDKQLFGVHGTFRFLGKEAKRFGSIINSEFNQLGFALFVTTSTFRNLQMIVKAVVDQINAMGQAAQRMIAFTNAIQNAGSWAGEFGNAIDRVSQGLVTQEALITNSIRLLRSQSDAMQALVPNFLEGAENLARLGGDITSADAAFSSLADAALRLEGAMITAGGATLDLSDATVLMEIEAARLGRALTEAEKESIWLSVAAEQLNAINEEAGNLPDIGEGFNKAGAEISSSVDLIKAAGGFFIDFFHTQFGVIGNVIDNIAQKLGQLPIAFGPIAERGLQSLGLLIGLFTDTQNTLLELATIFTEVFSRIGAGLSTFVQVVQELGSRIGTVAGIFLELDYAIRNMDFSGIGDAIGKLEEIRQTPINIDDMWNRSMEFAEGRADQFLEHFKMVIGLAEQTVEGADMSPKIDYTGVIGSLQDLLGPQAKLGRDLLNAQEDTNEKLLDAQEKFEESRADIIKDAADRRRELEEEHQERLNDIARDLSRKWQRINEDSEDRLRHIREDAQDRREDAAKKKADKLAEIEEDLQKKIDDILRKFELARIRALIDRDARALFEAEQRKREELAKAREDAKDKREDAKEDAQKELDDINENEQKKLAREREAAEKRRRRAQEDAEIRRLETIEQYEAQNAEIDALEEERLAEAEERFKKERKQIKKEYNQRINDLKEAFAERMFTIRAQYLIEQAERLQQLDRTTQEYQDKHQDWLDEYNEFLRQYEGLISDTIDLINSLGNATPGSLPLPTVQGGGYGGTSGASGGGQGTGGGGQPCAQTSDIAFVPAAGTPCSGVQTNRTLVAPDCSRWVCTEFPDGVYRWARDLAQITSGPVGSPVVTSPGGAGIFPLGSSRAIGSFGGASGGDRQRVTIEVHGDSTLEEIFKSLAFEAFIEATN